MDPARGVTYGSVGVILILTVSSGPMGVVDFTKERTENNTEGLGNGLLEVASLDAPDTASLQQGDFGSGNFYLRVPDAVLSIDAVEGRPIVSYKIEISELGYTRETAHVISSESGQRVTLSIQEDTLPPEDIQQDEYSGEIRIVKRVNGESTTALQRNVTVSVQR